MPAVRQYHPATASSLHNNNDIPSKWCSLNFEGMAKALSSTREGNTPFIKFPRPKRKPNDHHQEYLPSTESSTQRRCHNATCEQGSLFSTLQYTHKQRLKEFVLLAGAVQLYPPTFLSHDSFRSIRRVFMDLKIGAGPYAAQHI